MPFQTFSSAVFSQIEVEPLGGFWPRAIFCDRQGLSSKSVEAARLSLGLISYLTWSFHPSLVVPGVLDNTRVNMENVKGELWDIIQFEKEYEGSFDRFLSSLMVSCQEVIIECQIGSGTEIEGKECCNKYFEKKSSLTVHGTCFSLKPGQVPASEGITVTTRHEKLVMDQDILASEMVPSVGLAVAVVDTNISPQAAMKSQVCDISLPYHWLVLFVFREQ